MNRSYGLPMRGARRYLLRVAAILLAAVAPMPGARAQDLSMDAAAAQAPKAITHAKQKSVIVFDFVGPDHRLTALGEKLADDFSSMLSKSTYDFQVESRSSIAEVISKGQYSPDVIHLSPYDPVLASELKVKAYVTGTVTLHGQELMVLVKSRAVKDGKEITSLQFSVPLTGEMRNLLDKTVVDAPVPPYVDPDDKSYTSPKCLFCPRADYTGEALNYKTQGVVLLEAVVGADGRFQSIRVIKPLAHGLTAVAIATIKTWKLSPAKGPDGIPIVVRQTIEVSFQFH